MEEISGSHPMTTIFFHGGDDSEFVAKRTKAKKATKRK
jgi:hypothetical protein